MADVRQLANSLKAISKARTPSDLEKLFQEAHMNNKSHPSSRTWRQIGGAMCERGSALVRARQAGFYVPQYGARRQLTLCGEVYRVGCGQNSTGVRYCWTYAEIWANQVLHERGAPREVRKGIWDSCFDYPHRALAVAIEWRKHPNRPEPVYTRPQYIKFHETVRFRGMDEDRAMRPCPGCGGDQMDWGSGHIDYIEPRYSMEWRCMSCNRAEAEIMTTARLYQMRAKDPARIGYA